MIVIQHNDGWSVSNDGYIDTKRIPVYENGELKEWLDQKQCILNNIYTVSGKFEGDVNIAIKEDTTNKVYCYRGTQIAPQRIKLHESISNEWLSTLK